DDAHVWWISIAWAIAGYCTRSASGADADQHHRAGSESRFLGTSLGSIHRRRQYRGIDGRSRQGMDGCETSRRRTHLSRQGGPPAILSAYERGGDSSASNRHRELDPPFIHRAVSPCVPVESSALSQTTIRFSRE